jgi:N utilization substance protein A
MEKKQELMETIEQLGLGEKIDKKIIIDALQVSISSAIKKIKGVSLPISVQLDEKNNKIEIFVKKKVVEKVSNPDTEIDIKDAKLVNPDAKINDEIDVKFEFTKFARIAAQIARQVVIQKVRESEKEKIYEQIKDKLESIVNATVVRYERKNIIVDLGGVEAVLPRHEQIFKEKLERGDQIKVYVLDIKKTESSVDIIVSRAHPSFLKKLLELEIPEISQGIIEIKAIAREPGSRSKVAIASRNPNIDPVGTCVGLRAKRIQSISSELKDEKIDIINWDDNIKNLIANAISPAVAKKIIIDENIKHAEVIVDDNEFSLAIGKKGQNARLVSKLTGWWIDIKNESRFNEEKLSAINFLTKIDGITQDIAEKLFEHRLVTPKMIASSNPEEIAKILEVEKNVAKEIINSANEFIKNKK